MRRLLAAVLALALTLAFIGAFIGVAGAQTVETFALADLDFSSASIHQAGPASFYVRGVGIDDDAYSLLIEHADTGVWSVTAIIPEDANTLPPETILDAATIRASGDSTIRIDGVLVGERVYGGTLVVGEDAGLTLAALRDELAAQPEPPGTSPLTGEEVNALLTERDQLAGDVVGLVMENNELRSERKSLREQIEGLQDRNTVLKDDVQTMTGEVDRLQELVGGYVRASDLEAAAASVTAELQSLDRRLTTLTDAASGLAELEEALRAGVRDGLPRTSLAAAPAGELPGTRERAVAEAPSPEPETVPPEPESEPETADATEATEADARAAIEAAEQAERLARLQAEVAELLAENEALRTEKQRLEERVLEEILDNGFVRIMRERLTRTLASGFAAGAPDTGVWTVRDGSAVQTERDSYFAKLAMPVEQRDAPVLYSFRVRSLDDGWVGVGLHLFVDEVERRRGYGMGSSLLVWFTRDPEERKDATTYLQLYRSDDDVSMARVLDAAIPHDIGEFVDVDVLYEPDSQYVTIAVGGVDRVRYRTWFGIDSGVEIALRSLGRAEFRSFTVRSTP